LLHAIEPAQKEYSSRSIDIDVMITILDYGMGNLGSIANMVKKVGGTSVITSKIKDIEKAKKLILPGVGAFDNGMKNLKKMNLITLLNKKILEEKIPILSICLGMQLLSKKSEEGKLAGLGWIDAVTKRFKFRQDQHFPIPHMGWNTVTIEKKSKLFINMFEEPRFYFVHSYHLVCKNKQDILTTTNYGYDFVSSVKKNNIFGVQFHPEKSHRYGMKLIENYIKL
jgi:glutamine amidotransferase